MLQAGQQKRKVLCSLPSREGSLTPWGLGLSCSLHQPASTGSSKRSRRPGSCSMASRKALLQGRVPAGVGFGVSQGCAETGMLLVHWYRRDLVCLHFSGQSRGRALCAECTSPGRFSGGHPADKTCAEHGISAGRSQRNQDHKGHAEAKQHAVLAATPADSPCTPQVLQTRP